MYIKIYTMYTMYTCSPVQQVHGGPSKNVLAEILQPISKPSTHADKHPRNGLSKLKLKKTVEYDEDGVD